MEITKSMYNLAKKIVAEYESENKTNEKVIKNPSNFTEEVENCLKACLKHFPDNLHPSTPSEHKNWLECVEKLNRLDKIPFSWIEFLVKAAREDDFWSTNFLSLLKLRKKDPQKVKYVKVFYAKFGNQNKKQGVAESSLKAKDEAENIMGIK